MIKVGSKVIINKKYGQNLLFPELDLNVEYEVESIDKDRNNSDYDLIYFKGCNFKFGGIFAYALKEVMEEQVEKNKLYLLTLLSDKNELHSYHNISIDSVILFLNKHNPQLDRITLYEIEQTSLGLEWIPPKNFPFHQVTTYQRK